MANVMRRKLRVPMGIFEYYSSLRGEILEVVTGVENTGWNLFWDNTTPNYSTKIKLGKLYAKYLNLAANFGLYVFTRHCDCPSNRHPEDSEPGLYEFDISYGDERYIWSGSQMYQGNRYCACPCSSTQELTDHWVIDDVVYKKGSDLNQCKKLEDILRDIYKSMESAGDNNPRSAIRENLLRAVLRINDELLPEPMDSYIKKK